MAWSRYLSSTTICQDWSRPTVATIRVYRHAVYQTQLSFSISELYQSSLMANTYTNYRRRLEYVRSEILFSFAVVVCVYLWTYGQKHSNQAAYIPLYELYEVYFMELLELPSQSTQLLLVFLLTFRFNPATQCSYIRTTYVPIELLLQQLLMVVQIRKYERSAYLWCQLEGYCMLQSRSLLYMPLRQQLRIEPISYEYSNVRTCVHAAVSTDFQFSSSHIRTYQLRTYIQHLYIGTPLQQQVFVQCSQQQSRLNLSICRSVCMASIYPSIWQK